nr:Lrp/AsnC family transcriptional regulator [Halomonas sp. PR-M31]
MSDFTCRSDSTTDPALDEQDRAIVLATQSGLPLVSDPWAAVGEQIGMSAEEVRRRMQRMQETGVIRRIAAVPNHYRLGYVANGMTVWDVEDDQIERLSREIARHPGVSHCYRRRGTCPSGLSICSPCFMAAAGRRSSVKRKSLRNCWVMPAGIAAFSTARAFSRRPACAWLSAQI